MLDVETGSSVEEQIPPASVEVYVTPEFELSVCSSPVCYTFSLECFYLWKPLDSTPGMPS